jgi:VCBS repeat-containing protein
LRDSTAAGNTILHNVVEGQGTSAFIVGQLVTTSTTPTEKSIDVTRHVRGISNGVATFLVSQDPRWDVTLPTLEAGDTQADGVTITTTEGGNGPRLRLVFAAPNTAPVAAPDAYATDEDTPLVLSAPGVLANDSDAETNALNAVLVSTVAHGTLALNPDGGFTYQPASNYFGPDSFTYRALDGVTHSEPAVVTITVTPVNDPPVAVNDSAAIVRNRSAIIDVLANDDDVDGGVLQIAGYTQGNSGGVSETGSGTLSYTPDYGFTGADSFNYTVSDGQGGTNSAAVHLTVVLPGSPPYWTNLPVATEAFIRGGANADTDQDEAALGYLMVKYNPSPFDTARKAYFQFDLTGLPVNVNTTATLTVLTHTQTFRHHAQLWGLDQAYPGFSSSVVWNATQANATNSNDLWMTGPLTGSPIGDSYLFRSAPSTAHEFTLPRLGDFLFADLVTLVFCGVEDPTNDAGGLRLARGSATLQVLVTPPAPPATNSPPRITDISEDGDGQITLHFTGNAGWYYLVQATPSLNPATWLEVSTNLAGTDGEWIFTDAAPTSQPQRFYRAAQP